MAESSTRPLLPQGPRAYAFAPVNPEPREKQRNYVFVDEHNRHRRLKVMRACGACRKRKIKCDAATTNVWPCGPCMKQRLECVPPTAENEGANDQEYASSQNYDATSQRPKQESNTYYDVPTYTDPTVSGTSYQSQHSYHHSLPVNYASDSAAANWTQPSIEGYTQNNVSAASMTAGAANDYPQGSSWQPPSLTKAESVASDASWNPSQTDPDFISALGDLKISEDAVAPYITNQRSTLAEGPAVEERDVILPPSAPANSYVGVPPEMMPSDSEAMDFFNYYFVEIHPYIPVISPTVFYSQWHQNRRSISPLILDGIFACATQMTQANDERAKWLALGARHEESFKDVPRLSTIQGLIILLKAREAVPKRGYYYRSWMTIQYLISMAKDLELDKHLQNHRLGLSCSANDGDCPIKSRIWHTLFQLELMVGGPQGRTDFNVRLDSVNFDSPSRSPAISDVEFQVTQNQAHMIRIIRNVRITADLYAQFKSQKASEATLQGFVKHNRDFEAFFASLPQHLSISYPSDGAPPWITSHYVANLHIYAQLSIVMHYRPQLEGPGANVMGESWRKQMIMCHSAATKICLLQEAVLNVFGLNGYLSMLRGVNLSIYAILTCTMLHLVAITSPDPELNTNAKDFFVRHMRILERCAKEWPMPAVQVQIDSVRQAFSADLDKPFELKANFPYGSPSAPGSTPSEEGYPLHPHHESLQKSNQSSWTSYDGTNLTPPRTASTVSNAAGYQAMDSVEALPTTSGDVSVNLGIPNSQYQWNPAKVMESWNTAFNSTSFESPSPGMQNSQTMSTPPSVTSSAIYSLQHTPDHSYTQNMQVPMGLAVTPPHPIMTTQASNYSQQSQTATYGPIIPQPYITPSMWQDAVADSYGVGTKRRWQDGPAQYQDEVYKRMR